MFTLHVENDKSANGMTGKKVFIVEPFQDLLSLKQHKKCNTSTQRLEPYYPTRLVEIMPDTNGMNLRICVTREETLTGPYMTLSHRWGTASFLKLTLKNLPDLVKGFSVVDLPRTFQDAISVARTLGCKYLWIDSLCIIQDSTGDWLYEAGLMGRVYANSRCNIAATWNSSSGDGCFSERNVSEVEGIIVSPSWADVKDTTFRVIDFGLWENLITSASLNKRAWVVQERLLAPRVLHFGRSQLAWECHQVDACETYPAGLPISQQSAQGNQKGLDPDTDGKEVQSIGSYQPPNLRAYHVWNKIVAAYTAGELTIEADKLVAISGLAQNMQILLKDEYLAGLWKGTLSSDLLWRVTGGKQANGLPSTRAARYRAPTWSWAAIDGQIMPGRPNDARILISIEEAATEPLTSKNSLGQLKSGWMRLRGLLLPGNVKTVESSTSQQDHVNISFSAESNPKDLRIFPDVPGEISDQSIFCLIVSTANRYGGTEIQGLALHCIDTTKATYRRVGYFQGFAAQLPNQDFPLQYSREARRLVLTDDAEIKTIILI
ncbi:MAG: hypothetical protein Q9220_005258 [cf. Caloplaca sp. 1 TL-2023]